MKIVVCGGGVIGLSTAFLWASFGHDVTCLEREPCLAFSERQASRINGGLLCPSLTKSWTYISLHESLSILASSTLSAWLHNDSPIRIRPHVAMNPVYRKWGYHWLWSSDQTEYIRTLSQHSMRCFETFPFNQIAPSEYGRTAIGTRLQTGEIRTEDASGSVEDFCRSIVRRLEDNRGRSRVHFDTNVDTILTEGDHIVGLRDQHGVVHTGDMYILASGVRTRDLCAQIALDVPIIPVAGQIVTFGVDASKMLRFNAQLPGKMFLSPVYDHIRASAYADIGFDYASSHAEEGVLRSQQLIERVKQEFPDAVIHRATHGYRPLSPDDCPFIGRALPYKNLYVNAGHGSKGWTMSVGSAWLLYRIATRQPTELETHPFRVDRFQYARGQ